MKNKITFIYTNPVDTAHKLVASSSVPTMDVSWLRTQQRSEVWQSRVCDQVVLDVQFPGPVKPNCLSLIGDNISSLGSIRLQLNTSNNFAAPLIDHTIARGEGVIGAGEAGAGEDGFGGTDPVAWSALMHRGITQPWTYFFDPPADPTPFARITIADPVNFDKCIRAARIYVAESLQLSRNYAWGASVELVDPSKIYGGNGYPYWSDKKEPVLQFTIKIPALTVQERYFELMNFWFTVQLTDFFIAVFNPTTAVTRRLTSHYCKLVENPSLQEAYLNRNDATLKFIEVI